MNPGLVPRRGGAFSPRLPVLPREQSRASNARRDIAESGRLTRRNASAPVCRPVAGTLTCLACTPSQDDVPPSRCSAHRPRRRERTFVVRRLRPHCVARRHDQCSSQVESWPSPAASFRRSRSGCRRRACDSPVPTPPNRTYTLDGRCRLQPGWLYRGAAELYVNQPGSLAKSSTNQVGALLWIPCARWLAHQLMLTLLLAALR